ncbi:MAG: HIT domain-containing protein [Gemmatimonadetes bacterium]|nr:HIT domain-containing protein [Gemmatimonadota bacterium]
MSSQSDVCVFCQIAVGRIPAATVGEGEGWVAFADLNPQAPVHILVIPRQHYSGLPELRDRDLAGRLVTACHQVAGAAGLDKGYRVVVNSGRRGGQTVPHLHFHVMGGRQMKWPPG